MLGLKIRWLGHASFMIKSGEKVIYMDPYEGDYMEKADLILVSHSHYDHCDASKIRRARKEGTVIIAPPECASKIEGAKPIKPGEKATVDNIVVEAVPAYNYKRFRAPGTPFHPKGFGVGYVITVEGRRIYHAGDTDFIPEMKELKDIDLALLPIGGTYTMDSPEAAEAARAINPKAVIPMHYFGADPEEFRRLLESTSPDIKIVILKPGEEYELKD
ncbi:MAG: conserved hypothetical protein, metallo-beta-lactamase superfamily [Candidatus Bathyarchaeota archaeon B26-1]|nr:MAG: conserved hypothetical protein, metallo-beta-lactamase superfamily [Candidatus Bathyarchaeota archaeon B26-1]